MSEQAEPCPRCGRLLVIDRETGRVDHEVPVCGWMLELMVRHGVGPLTAVVMPQKKGPPGTKP